MGRGGRARAPSLLLPPLPPPHLYLTAQVALNWCLCKGTLPIPGAKNARQAAEAAGALGWRLDPGEVAELDGLSAKISPGLGFPTETW